MAAVEFYPTVFMEQYEDLKGKLRPYGIVGVGVYHFNPKTQDNNGNWVALQPLTYRRTGLSGIPGQKSIQTYPDGNAHGFWV